MSANTTWQPSGEDGQVKLEHAEACCSSFLRRARGRRGSRSSWIAREELFADNRLSPTHSSPSEDDFRCVGRDIQPSFDRDILLTCVLFHSISSFYTPHQHHKHLLNLARLGQAAKPLPAHPLPPLHSPTLCLRSTAHTRLYPPSPPLHHLAREHQRPIAMEELHRLMAPSQRRSLSPTRQ